MAPYNANIPQAPDIRSNSQNDLLNNFQALNTSWEVNHIGFNIAGAGKHYKVTFPEQAANPVTPIDEVVLFSKESTRTSLAELFVRKENNGAVIEFTSSNSATPGWTRLPSGILLKWGATTANGAATVTLPSDGDVAIPDFTIIYSVQLTVVAAGGTDTDGAVRVVSFAAATGFNVYASARSTTGAKAVNFEYLVIGE